MSLRFAAARPAALPVYIARAQLARMATRAANDNGGGESHAEACPEGFFGGMVHGIRIADERGIQARLECHRTGISVNSLMVKPRLPAGPVK